MEFHKLIPTAYMPILFENKVGYHFTLHRDTNIRANSRASIDVGISAELPCKHSAFFELPSFDFEQFNYYVIGGLIPVTKHSIKVFLHNFNDFDIFLPRGLVFCKATIYPFFQPLNSIIE